MECTLLALTIRTFTFFVYITERKGMLFDKLHHSD